MCMCMRVCVCLFTMGYIDNTQRRACSQNARAVGCDREEVLARLCVHVCVCMCVFFSLLCHHRAHRRRNHSSRQSVCGGYDDATIHTCTHAHMYTHVHIHTCTHTQAHTVIFCLNGDTRHCKRH